MSTISIFIKRAEEYHDHDFIVNTFYNNNFGKVNKLTFIPKQTDLGVTYFGVIVEFEYINMNDFVKSLLEQMSNSIDGTTKFYFTAARYWFINVHEHKPNTTDTIKCEDLSTNDLYALVYNLQVENTYLSSKQERCERIMMDYEQKHTRAFLLNLEVKDELQDVADELDLVRHELSTSQKECAMHVSLRNEYEEVLRKKNAELEALKQEVYDLTNVVAYYEQQQQLESVNDNDDAMIL